MTPRASTFGDFRCVHCGGPVSADHGLSGVNHRNHCPYCLWSRHLDLFAAGDRLSACKAPMRPAALTLKRSRNKYASVRGELMLVHACLNCGTLSINRIAADDDPGVILEVLDASTRLPPPALSRFRQNGIEALGAESQSLVREQLFGRVTRQRVGRELEVME